jgi:hypothetical protein
MKMINAKGMSIAAAAASLFMAGCSMPIAGGETAKVHCTGVNSCKGTSDCKTASSSCKGQNSCKGQGWKELSKAECDSAGGKAAAATSKVLVADSRSR